MTLERRLHCYNCIFSLTSPTPADEPQVVELGNLILHHSRAVPEFCGAVLVVAGSNGDQRPISDFSKSDHFERHWESFVGPPVWRKDCAYLEKLDAILYRLSFLHGIYFVLICHVDYCLVTYIYRSVIFR